MTHSYHHNERQNGAFGAGGQCMHSFISGGLTAHDDVPGAAVGSLPLGDGDWTLLFEGGWAPSGSGIAAGVRG
jgi:hypothetical protein